MDLLTLSYFDDCLALDDLFFFIPYESSKSTSNFKPLKRLIKQAVCIIFHRRGVG